MKYGEHTGNASSQLKGSSVYFDPDVAAFLLQLLGFHSNKLGTRQRRRRPSEAFDGLICPDDDLSLGHPIRIQYDCRYVHFRTQSKLVFDVFPHT